MKKVAALLLVTMAAGLFAWSAPARAYNEQQELVDKALLSIKKITARTDINNFVKQYLRQAKGVLVIPALLKAGFIVGGEGGSGVLLAKGKSGEWSYPAFYTMGAASIGIQFGGQVSETMLIIMTSKGLNSIISNKVTLGGELNAAVGPYGVGVEGATSTALGADIITYSVGKGAFLGGGLEGSVIEKRDSLNQGYYKDPQATPEAIVLQGRYKNADADRLRDTLANFK
ncbi:MAG: lipid-binding SYLF domain-containing protein [Rhodospirillaceae bacterium]|nr:lipid-binding SYLF domain-containing protein [Rhodospirillaceae bacterium]